MSLWTLSLFFYLLFYVKIQTGIKYMNQDQNENKNSTKVNDIKKKFYITTTLPYVNAEPHIGHAMEFIRADVIARAKRALGYDVLFNTGTDEHGSKLYEGALKENMTPQAYVDKYSQRFKDFHNLANISYDRFIRTTDEKHILAAQKMWKRCFDNGDIYKKNYKTKYCVGCELEKTDSELVDGKCIDHPTKTIEERDEENYFFKFSNYGDRLSELYNKKNDSSLDVKNTLKNNSFVIPDSRQNEVSAFVKNGLQDFSISRLKSKMPWGVDVPGDSEHVMYVWFDALTSYISTLGWGYDESSAEYNDFIKYWEQDTNFQSNGGDGVAAKSTEANENKRQVVQYCGKDNNRQQSAMWQAMLMSAGVPSSTNIIINGFIQSGGQKMSKSTGNVISPFDIINEYKDLTPFPEEVLRFIVTSEVSTFEDGDLTVESMRAAYQSKLSNGIGNLTSRIMKMATTNFTETIKIEGETLDNINSEVKNRIENLCATYDHSKYMQEVWHDISVLDEYISENAPFKKVKSEDENIKAEGLDNIIHCVHELYKISELIKLAMPKTSALIQELISEHKLPERPIFNRLS